MHSMQSRHAPEGQIFFRDLWTNRGSISRFRVSEKNAKAVRDPRSVRPRGYVLRHL